MHVDTPGAPTAASVPVERPPEPVIRHGGTVHKVVVNSETGETTYSKQAPTKAAPSAPPSPDAIVVTGPQGSPIPLWRAGPKDKVRIPQLGEGTSGETSIETAVHLGYLRPALGGGYESTMPASAAPAPVAPVPPTEIKPDAAKGPDGDGEISMEGVSGTSPITDITMSMLKKDAGETMTNGITMAMIRGLDADGMIQDVARRAGKDPAEVKEAVEAVTADYTRAARQVAMANGLGANAGAWSAFVAWASERQPDAALSALTNFVEKHEAGGLARLVRQFSRTENSKVAFSDDEILNASFGSGIKAVRTDKGVQLSIPGHGTMSLKTALARGIVRTS
jgi:hypothetical protein